MIDYLVCESPVPLFIDNQFENVQVSLKLCDQVFTYHNNPIGIDYNFKNLFRVLSLENIARVIEFVLLEKKIIFVSDKYYLLSTVIQTIRQLILPFEWNYTCIYILPRTHDSLINAIFPFMIGLCLDIDNRDIDTTNDVIIVDLNKDTIEIKNQIITPSEQIQKPSLKELQ